MQVGQGIVAGARGRAALTAFVALLLIPAAARADGELDPSFDGDGRAISDPTPLNEQVADIAIDASGRIVVVGTGRDPKLESPSRALVARFNSDGSLDESFSGDGFELIGWTAQEERAHSVSIDGLGRIVVGGKAFFEGKGWDFAAARYLDNGVLDGGFDTDGRATLDISGNSGDDSYGMTTDAQNRVLLVGTTAIGMGTNSLAVARFTAAGTPDPSLEGDGSVLASFPGLTNPQGRAVAVDGAGRITVAGGAVSPTASWDFAALRLLDNGIFDAAFDGDGRVTADLTASLDVATDLALDGSGRVVLVGYSEMSGGEKQTDVVRLLDNGAIDTGFGAAGKVVIADSASSREAAVAIDRAGRVAVAGATASGGGEDAMLVRYSSEGALDGGFGQGGVLREDYLAPEANGEALAIDAQGRYVMGGTAVTGSDLSSIGLARFLATYPEAPAQPISARVQRCQGVRATRVGTSKRNFIKGTRKRDVIVALGGNDTIRALGGNDLVCAGAGKDVVKAGGGNDRVLGGAGADRVFGQAGKDTLLGEAGRDLLAGGAARDKLKGGAGRDAQRQ